MPPLATDTRFARVSSGGHYFWTRPSLLSLPVCDLCVMLCSRIRVPFPSLHHSCPDEAETGIRPSFGLLRFSRSNEANIRRRDFAGTLLLFHEVRGVRRHGREMQSQSLTGTLTERLLVRAVDPGDVIFPATDFDVVTAASSLQQKASSE